MKRRHWSSASAFERVMPRVFWTISLKRLICSGVGVGGSIRIGARIRDGCGCGEAMRWAPPPYGGLNACISLNPYAMNHKPQAWTDKAIASMEEKAQRGVMPNRAPLGYINTRTKQNRNISLDYPTYRVIENLFRAVANGYSLKEAGIFAGYIGLKNRKGGTLNPSSVRAVVTNPFYTGRLRYKGELLPGKHPPLVSQELFEEVQAALSKRSERFGGKAESESDSQSIWKDAMDKPERGSNSVGTSPSALPNMNPNSNSAP